MGFLGSISRLVRRPGNRRVARYARRAAHASPLALGASQKEGLRLWRVVLWAGVALVLAQLESGLLRHLAPTTLLKVEVPVAIAIFCALQLPAIEGAVAAFALGYVADLFVQGPPGLCRFMAVATWTGVRLASARIHLPPLLATLGFGFVGTLGYQVGVLLGLSLVADVASGPGTIAWLSAVPGAALTAIAAVPLHAGLARLDEATAGGAG